MTTRIEATEQFIFAAVFFSIFQVKPFFKVYHIATLTFFGTCCRYQLKSFELTLKIISGLLSERGLNPLTGLG